MTVESVKSYIGMLSDIAQNSTVENGKAVSSKKDPGNVKSRVKALFTELSTVSIDPYEKAGLYTALASSLAEYRCWMEHNEEALRSTVDAYNKLAVNILRREEKLTERATKLLEWHKASMESAKEPILIDQIDDLYRNLQDASLVDMDATEAFPEKLSPLRLLKTVEKFCLSISSESGTFDQKKNLYKKLLSSLELYRTWMGKHKDLLEEKFLSYDAIQDKVHAKCQELQEKIKPVSKPQEKPKPVRGVFTRNFPMKMVSFDPSHYVYTGFKDLERMNTCFKQAIAEIRQDKAIGRVLDVYHKREGGNQNLDTFLKSKLNGGLCYGRVMTYIARIKQNQERKLNIESLWKAASEKDFIKNQILHHMYVHLVNRQASDLKRFFETATQSLTGKIAALFPVTNPKVLQGKKLSISNKKLVEDSVRKRILKNPTKNKVLIFQYSKPSSNVGHVSLVYCSKKNDDYLFYDSYSDLTGGLYTANTEAALVKKSVEKVLDCAQKEGFTNISLHSYNL